MINWTSMKWFSMRLCYFFLLNLNNDYALYQGLFKRLLFHKDYVSRKVQSKFQHEIKINFDKQPLYKLSFISVVFLSCDSPYLAACMLSFLPSQSAESLPSQQEQSLPPTLAYFSQPVSYHPSYRGK